MKSNINFRREERINREPVCSQAIGFLVSLFAFFFIGCGKPAPTEISTPAAPPAAAPQPSPTPTPQAYDPSTNNWLGRYVPAHDPATGELIGCTINSTGHNVICAATLNPCISSPITISVDTISSTWFDMMRNGKLYVLTGGWHPFDEDWGNGGTISVPGDAGGMEILSHGPGQVVFAFGGWGSLSCLLVYDVTPN